MHRTWQRRPAPPAGFSTALGLPPLHAHLLYSRGIRSRPQAEAFLRPDPTLQHDPMLLAGMRAAVDRLRRALESGECVGVFGDFDVDGVTGTALLMQALRSLGADVTSYIPDRLEEGHGLSDAAIRELRDRGVSLLVTVDCGITSVKEVGLASSLGIDTIVTDHHPPLQETPDACALIDPRLPGSAYPFPDLTGVGTSFKLVQALYSALGKAEPSHLLELVALGTVADVGPLVGENRYFVKRGLELLNRSESPGILALVAASRLRMGSLDAESLSFGLIPRLNAAGRLGSAAVSLDLLTAPTLRAAQPLAEELDSKNSRRREITQQAMEEARAQVEAASGGGSVPSLVIARSDKWIPGILGLIAGRIADLYYRPAVAVSIGPEVSRASARSIPEFDIVAALSECDDLFLRFGGHPQAAGFTVPTSALPDVERRLVEAADAALGGLVLRPALEIDCEAPLGLVAGESFGFIQSLSPFGEGNPKPTFLTRDLRVLEARRVGAAGQHLKLRVADGRTALDAIAFRQGGRQVAPGHRLDLVYTVGTNDWGGIQKRELTVEDLRPRT